MTRLEDCQKEVDRLLYEIDSPYRRCVHVVHWSHIPEPGHDEIRFRARARLYDAAGLEGTPGDEFEVEEVWLRADIEKMQAIEEFSGQSFGPVGSLAMKICDHVYKGLENRTFGEAQLQAACDGKVMNHLQRAIEERKANAKWK